MNAMMFMLMNEAVEVRRKRFELFIKFCQMAWKNEMEKVGTGVELLTAGYNKARKEDIKIEDLPGWEDVTDILGEAAESAYWLGWLNYIFKYCSAPTCTPGFAQHIYYLGPVAGKTSEVL